MSAKPRRSWSSVAWSLLAMLAMFAFGLSCMGARDELVDRSDEVVLVAADEVVAETLVVEGDTVDIAGTIDGDAIVSARHVVVSGTIRGNLEVMGQEVEIDTAGIVEGAVHCLCERMTVRGEVQENAYLLGRSLLVSSGGQVGRDAFVLGATASVQGEVGRDLWAYTDELSVPGRVGRYVIEVEEPEPAPPKYTQASWYLMQLAQVFAAFIVGLLLFRLFPRLKAVPLASARAVLVGMGIGAIVLIVTPLVSVLAMATIVGLPIGLIVLGAYLAGLYLSGIVAAGRVGQAMLGRRRDRIGLALAVGLVLLTVLTELPFVGVLFRVVAIVLGLGILYRAARSAAAPTNPSVA